MTVISIRDAKNRLTEIARQVENGETITVTRNGRPILDLVPHRPQKGLRWEGIDAFKEKYGLATIISDIRDDFDDPLPEDFLLHPISNGPPSADR
jgi:prevent-host-death family protein